MKNEPNYEPARYIYRVIFLDGRTTHHSRINVSNTELREMSKAFADIKRISKKRCVKPLVIKTNFWKDNMGYIQDRYRRMKKMLSDGVITATIKNGINIKFKCCICGADASVNDIRQTYIDSYNMGQPFMLGCTQCIPCGRPHWDGDQLIDYYTEAIEKGTELYGFTQKRIDKIELTEQERSWVDEYEVAIEEAYGYLILTAPDGQEMKFYKPYKYEDKWEGIPALQLYTVCGNSYLNAYATARIYAVNKDDAEEKFYDIVDTDDENVSISEDSGYVDWEITDVFVGDL